jgi:pyruvate-formate lyase-activating enzyme
MEMSEEIGPFRVLEKKVEALIVYTASLKQEKERLVEKLHTEEKKTRKLMNEIKELKAVKVNVKQRVATLLERIERVDA